MIAGRLRGALRKDDDDRSFVARYGGEEFVVLLDNCAAPAALAVGERLRLAVSDGAIRHPSRPDGLAIVTVSLGIAVSIDGREITSEMLNRADVALYEAKRQGRDRLVLATGHSGAIAGPKGFAGAETAPVT
jgi:diguanylate cyclase (GGDEF)-like protein